MVNIMRVALANSGSVTRGSHQPASMGSCLLVTCGSPVYLVVDDFSPCALWSLMIGLMVVLLTFSSHGDCGFTHGELILF